MAKETSSSPIKYYQYLALSSIALITILGTITYALMKKNQTIRLKSGALNLVKGLGYGFLAFIVFIATNIVLFKSTSYSIGGITGYTLYFTYTLGIALVASLLIYTMHKVVPTPQNLATITGLVLVLSYLIAIRAFNVPALIAIYAVGASAALLYAKRGINYTTGFIAIVLTLTALNPITLRGSGLLHSIIYAIILLILTYYLKDIETVLKMIKSMKLDNVMKVGLILAIIAAVLIIGTHMAGIRAYIVVSGSMEPTLNIGDIIIVSPQDTYTKGDIISFHHKAYIITHRIVEINDSNQETQVFTKGDANSQPDPYKTTKDEIIGKEVLSIPYLGWFLILLNWNIYVKLIVFTASMMAIGYLVWKYN